MAVKRGKTKRGKGKAKKRAFRIYEAAMLAEGAPVALDLLEFGSALSDFIRGRPPEPASRPRAKKKTPARTKIKAKAKTRTSRTRKKADARSSRRKR